MANNKRFDEAIRKFDRVFEYYMKYKFSIDEKVYRDALNAVYESHNILDIDRVGYIVRSEGYIANDVVGRIIKNGVIFLLGKDNYRKRLSLNNFNTLIEKNCELSNRLPYHLKRFSEILTSCFSKLIFEVTYYEYNVDNLTNDERVAFQKRYFSHQRSRRKMLLDLSRTIKNLCYGIHHDFMAALNQDILVLMQTICKKTTLCYNFLVPDNTRKQRAQFIKAFPVAKKIYTDLFINSPNVHDILKAIDNYAPVKSLIISFYEKLYGTNRTASNKQCMKFLSYPAQKLKLFGHTTYKTQDDFLFKVLCHLDYNYWPSKSTQWAGFFKNIDTIERICNAMKITPADFIKANKFRKEDWSSIDLSSVFFDIGLGNLIDDTIEPYIEVINPSWSDRVHYASINKLLHLHRKWHVNYTKAYGIASNILMNNECYFKEQPKFPEVVIYNIAIRHLTQLEELCTEGYELSHCVETYTHKVMTGRSLIFSMQDIDDREERSTLELRYSSKFKLLSKRVQHYSYDNSPAPKNHRDCLKPLVEYLNKQNKLNLKDIISVSTHNRDLEIDTDKERVKIIRSLLDKNINLLTLKEPGLN